MCFVCLESRHDFDAMFGLGIDEEGDAFFGGIWDFVKEILPAVGLYDMNHDFGEIGFLVLSLCGLTYCQCGGEGQQGECDRGKEAFHGILVCESVYVYFLSICI